ncbi:MAG: antibiotic biosynthesis monooxygenase [Actinomycetota bacterium]|nr:antibiotic biosynthesis monooxygenase [Actinomycetota bacterium]
MLLIVPFEVPAGEDDGFRSVWEKVRERFSAHRGYLGAQLLRSTDSRFVAVVHWSSPLMYARTVRQEGDVLAALPFRGHAALYVFDSNRDFGRLRTRAFSS